MERRTRRRNRTRGQALIEFALLAPFIFIFLFAIVDFGLAINNRVVVTNAAREAARYGATGATVADIQQAAVNHTDGLVTDPSSVEVKFYDTNGDGKLLPGDSVAVKIPYTYDLVTPLGGIMSWFNAMTIDIHACADMRLEQVSITATIDTGTPLCQ